MLGEGSGPSASESLGITPSLSPSPPPFPSPSLSPSSPPPLSPLSSPSTKARAKKGIYTPKKNKNNSTSPSSSPTKSRSKKKEKNLIHGSQSQSDSDTEDYPTTQDTAENMGLSTLPYDLLLNIATYLDLRDVHALQLTCRSLYDASTTRPVYRKLANDLLRRCRALPLKGFQRLADLSTESLIHAVNKANHYEAAWRVRAPRPIKSEVLSASGVNSHSNYMDVCVRGGGSGNGNGGRQIEKGREQRSKWYKIVSAPPGEEVDWLSPITSSYTLCATKSGKVVCWDVQSDTCLAEWNPGARWELWKCRVEFEERTVFFTMAKVLTGSYDDDRVMKFVLMRLTFSDGPSGESSIHPPVFSRVTEFRTTGVVMNVFLLDPSERLLSAFIWVSTSNTIGLYALPDWNEKEYVFIDTGIECVMSSNWSCILYQQHIVIHCEESDAAFQHFYPLSLLRSYTSTLPDAESSPAISRRVPPARTLKKKFIFPPLFPESEDSEPELEADMHSTIHEGYLQDVYGNGNGTIPILNGNANTSQVTSSSPSLSTSSSSSSSTSSSTSSASSSSSSSSSLLITAAPAPAQAAPAPSNPNPYPFPPWYPESAHFVRQWWPTLPNIPRVSCTVVLLAAHDQTTHRTRFVLAQHYFRVPLDHAEWEEGEVALAAAEASLVGTAAKDQENGNGSPSPSSSSRHPLPNHTHTNHNYNHTRVPTPEDAQDDALMHLWYVSTPFEVVRVLDGPEEEEDGTQTERPRPLVAVDFGHAVWIEYADVDADADADVEGGAGVMDEDEDEIENENEEEGDGEDNAKSAGAGANGTESLDVDFLFNGGSSALDSASHVAPVEGGSAAQTSTNTSSAGGDVDANANTNTNSNNNNTNGNTNTNGTGTGGGVGNGNRTGIVDSEPKALRFVTFPPFSEEYGVELDRRSSSGRKTNSIGGSTRPDIRIGGVAPTSGRNGTGSRNGGRGSSNTNGNGSGVHTHNSAHNTGGTEGQVRTLEIPDELDLGTVETINIDQSQGAIILSDKTGRIFILCYE